MCEVLMGIVILKKDRCFMWVLGDNSFSCFITNVYFEHHFLEKVRLNMWCILSLDGLVIIFRQTSGAIFVIIITYKK